MSDTQSRVGAGGAESTPPGVAAPGSAPGSAPEATSEAAPESAEPARWVGWVVFAGCMMIILGTFQVLAGLAALFNDGYYIVTSDDLLVSVDYTGWGWVHLILGVLVLAAGFGVLAGQTWARIVGIVFAGLSAIINLGFLASFPLWSVVMIALDVIVIYALSMHGRELQQV